MKVLWTYWFSAVSGTIGVVIGEDEITGDMEAYIGLAAGVNQETDTEMLRKWGTPLSPAVLQEIVARLKPPQKGQG